MSAGLAVAARAFDDDRLAVLVAGVTVTRTIRDSADDGPCACPDRRAHERAFGIAGGNRTNRRAETAADSRAGADIAFLLRASSQGKRRYTGNSHFPDHFFTSL
jgi:hypothetical protein